MEIIATGKQTGNGHDPVPSGNYVARCYSIVYMGTLTEDYLGETKTARKVRITWELPTETKVFKEENGEQPYVLSKEFTLSLHEKATLRKWLESWRGKGFTNKEVDGFDITKLLGAPCMLNIIHKERKDGGTFASIASISAMPKNMDCPKAFNPTVLFSVDNFDSLIFDSFPQFLKDKIMSSKEYNRMMQPQEIAVNDDHFDDSTEVTNDLPF